MGERQEVEVADVCPNCGGVGEAWYTHESRFPLGCHTCHGSREIVIPRKCAPGSLTAARLRLADAAEAWMLVPEENPELWRALRDATAALAALRTKRAGG